MGEEDASSVNAVVSEIVSPDVAGFADDLSPIEADEVVTSADLPQGSYAHDPRSASPIEELRKTVAGLSEQVAMDHARAAAREKIIDRLHGELERLRAGEVRLLLRPVIADLRRLHRDLLAQARSAGTISPAQAVALLESFAESTELALERCGVAVIWPEPGTPCQPGPHQVTGFEPTGDISLDGTIVKVASVGYLDLDSGRPIAPARVLIYRAAPSEDPVEAGHDAGHRSQAGESPPANGTDSLPSA